MRATPLLRNVKPSPTISTALKERVRRPAFLQRLTRAEDLVPLFKVCHSTTVVNINLTM